MKNSNQGFTFIVVLLIVMALASVVVVGFVGFTNPSIIGTLTPARDLEGTWVSALRGKGAQLYGEFSAGPSVTKIWEDGDVELKIDSVKDNIASGNIRYTDLCTYGESTVQGYASVSVPKTCIQDTGPLSIQITVSGSRLDFGATNVAGVSGSMTGSYTTDLMSGTMTFATAYGVVEGEFRLIRQR